MSRRATSDGTRVDINTTMANEIGSALNVVLDAPPSITTPQNKANVSDVPKRRRQCPWRFDGWKSRRGN